jgi:alkanesulfonate monooxygenase SsuD/methylene tetrahydromethanopterin reductase-like flavin-dependent oxidoreductase (luciferase family)
MDVDLQMVFASYGWSNVSDEHVWDEELRLARLAADLGFDVLWSVEHHFNACVGLSRSLRSAHHDHQDRSIVIREIGIVIT